MTHKGQRHYLLFIILASNTTPIIGLASSERLNLIKRVYKVTESTIEESFSSSKIPDDYPECFDEISTLKSTYHMEIKDDVSRDSSCRTASQSALCSQRSIKERARPHGKNDAIQDCKIDANNG